MTYLDEAIERCRKAAAGELNQDEMKLLGEEIHYAYSHTSKVSRVSDHALSHRWNEVIAILRSYKDSLDHELEKERAGAASVSQSVTLSVSISQTFDAINSLDIEKSEKDKAKALIAEAQNESDEKKRGETVLEAVKWAVNTGVEALKAISPAIPYLFQSL